MILRLQLVKICVACMVLSGCAHSNSMRNLLKHADTNDAEVNQLTAIARLTERHGDLDKARELYSRALAHETAQPLANHRLGVIAAKQGDLSGALDFFQKAKSLGLQSVDLQVDWAYALLLQDNPKEAETRFKQALEIEPANKRALNNLAILYGTQGRFEEGLALSARAVGSAKAHANMGYLLSRYGDLEQAAESYHIALAKDPALKIAAQALLQLEGVSSPAPQLAHESKVVNTAHEEVPSPAIHRQVSYEEQVDSEQQSDSQQQSDSEQQVDSEPAAPLPPTLADRKAKKVTPPEQLEVPAVRDFVTLERRRKANFYRDVRKESLTPPLQMEPHTFSLSRLPAQ